SDLQLDRASIAVDGSVQVSVQVTNTGDRAGKEVVELYSSDLYASRITPDMRRLRRFTKLELQPGETRTVKFTLNAKDLAYVDNEGKTIVEPGDFDLSIGDLKVRLSVTE